MRKKYVLTILHLQVLGDISEKQESKSSDHLEVDDALMY